MQGYAEIEPEDFILVSSWEKLAKEIGLEFCPAEHIHEVFGRADTPRTIVSGYSDFSIRVQAENHPNSDLHKLAERVNWQKVMGERGRYYVVPVGPACESKNCSPQHHFSVKIDSYTNATFHDIPSTVNRWFCTNLDINHPRATWIPFGLNDHGPGLGLLPAHRNKKKTGLLYVNIQDNTSERTRLKEWYKENCPWATVRMTADLPIDQFLDEVASHKFVLSPFGNGLDCHRNYEAMYLGSVPIVQASRFARHMSACGLPVATAPSLFGLRPENLEQVWDQMVSLPFDFDGLRLSTWERVLGASLH